MHFHVTLNKNGFSMAVGFLVVFNISSQKYYMRIRKDAFYTLYNEHLLKWKLEHMHTKTIWTRIDFSNQLNVDVDSTHLRSFLLLAIYCINIDTLYSLQCTSFYFIITCTIFFAGIVYYWSQLFSQYLVSFNRLFSGLKRCAWVDDHITRKLDP